ncbi:multidrug effflux MFS transporter [Photobacterium minamisatsumaniensis]|uniref:multidrug effflux MFS transporter n=1 Tax=Photobacterium minamisatsumaniensis TaxID=2910233 RepID=UPI003D0EB638
MNGSNPAISSPSISPPSMLTLVLLTGLSAMSISIFLPSLPQMAEYFDVEYSVIQLSISGYIAMNAVVQFVIGPLSDRFGRRTMMLWACMIFVLATIGCLLTDNAYVFLFFRTLQAVVISAGVIARAVVRDIADERDAASMIGYIMMGMSMVPMIGPTLGGFLGEWFGWQASFILLLISGIAISILTYVDMGETAPQTRSSLVQQVKSYPNILNNHAFWAYSLITMFANGTFFLFLTGGPIIGSVVFEMSPSVFGLYFAFTPLGYLIGNYLSGRFSKHYGMQKMIAAGIVFAAIGLVAILLLSYSGLTTPIIFFGLMFLVGLGNGLILPNATVGMLSVKPELIGSASGLGAAIMTGGGAILSTSASIVVYSGSGVTPMVWLMLLTFGLVALLYWWSCTIKVEHSHR